MVRSSVVEPVGPTVSYSSLADLYDLFTPSSGTHSVGLLRVPKCVYRILATAVAPTQNINATDWSRLFLRPSSYSEARMARFQEATIEFALENSPALPTKHDESMSR